MAKPQINFSLVETYAIYAALLNSTDAVTQEHDDHVRMWGNPAIPTRQGQRSGLRVKMLEHQAAMDLVLAKIKEYNDGH